MYDDACRPVPGAHSVGKGSPSPSSSTKLTKYRLSVTGHTQLAIGENMIDQPKMQSSNPNPGLESRVETKAKAKSNQTKQNWKSKFGNIQNQSLAKENGRRFPSTGPRMMTKLATGCLFIRQSLRHFKSMLQIWFWTAVPVACSYGRWKTLRLVPCIKGY